MFSSSNKVNDMAVYVSYLHGDMAKYVTLTRDPRDLYKEIRKF